MLTDEHLRQISQAFDAISDDERHGITILLNLMKVIDGFCCNISGILILWSGNRRQFVKHTFITI